MKLSDIVDQIDSLDEDECICMVKPWGELAECKTVELDDSMAVPAGVKSAGFEYFLEVNVAKEVLEVFGSRPATKEEKVRLLVHYAEHDAYPDWAYQQS